MLCLSYETFFYVCTIALFYFILFLSWFLLRPLFLNFIWHQILSSQSAKIKFVTLKKINVLRRQRLMTAVPCCGRISLGLLCLFLSEHWARGNALAIHFAPRSVRQLWNKWETGKLWIEIRRLRPCGRRLVLHITDYTDRPTATHCASTTTPKRRQASRHRVPCHFKLKYFRHT
jgi:hypothetical protein